MSEGISKQKNKIIDYYLIIISFKTCATNSMLEDKNILETL